MSNTKREPIVIELTGRDNVKVNVLRGLKGHRITFHAVPGFELFEIYNAGGGRVGTVPLHPDPVRVAVQAERERWKEQICALADGRGYTKALTRQFIDAIDAPAEKPETVSEYDRGRLEMKKECLDACANARDISQAVEWVSRLHVTEPASG